MRLAQPEKTPRSDTQFRIECTEKSLTSFCGLAILIRFFRRIGLYAFFRKFDRGGDFTRGVVYLCMLVARFVGIFRPKHLRLFNADALLARAMGLDRLPSASTVSRALRGTTESDLETMNELYLAIARSRLADHVPLARLVSVDFDGTVLSTRGAPEGSAKGYNPIKKGARSYYPLLAHLGALGQIIGVLWRPGNVVDSTGAVPFIVQMLRKVRALVLPSKKLLARLDSAFCKEQVLSAIEGESAYYLCAMPPHWITATIQRVSSWSRIGLSRTRYAQRQIKLSKWSRERNVLIIRRPKREADAQMEMFIEEHRYEYKVIVTNLPAKFASARRAEVLYNGRSGIEKTIAEGKTLFGADQLVARIKGLANAAAFQLSFLAHALMGAIFQQPLSFKHVWSTTRTVLNPAALTVRALTINLPARLVTPQGVPTLRTLASPTLHARFRRLVERCDRLQPLAL